MKINVILFLLLLSAFISRGQDYSSFQSLEFKSKDDYKQYEDKVLEMATYVLSVPIDNANKNRLIALQTIINWMSGTPDYQFGIDASIEPLMKKNDEIIGLYMASMTKYSLSNKEKASDPGAVKLNSFSMLLEYCEKESNGIRKFKELDKAITARNNGKLKEYLKM